MCICIYDCLWYSPRSHSVRNRAVEVGVSALFPHQEGDPANGVNWRGRTKKKVRDHCFGTRQAFVLDLERSLLDNLSICLMGRGSREYLAGQESVPGKGR